MLADRLASIGITDSVPTWEALTAGEDDVAGQIGTVPSEALPTIAEVLAESWEQLTDDEKVQICGVVARRVADVRDPLMFASLLDRLTPAAVVLRADVAAQLQTHLLALVRDRVSASGEEMTPEDARARFALGAAVDLVCTGATTRYALLAVLDELRSNLPTDLAGPAANAAGRLAEQEPDPLYGTLLARVLEIRQGEGDACVELGHASLRDAAATPQVEDALRLVEQARQFYRDAVASDESRPDAVAFAAAADLVLAFSAGSDADALSPIADEMERAAWELTHFEAADAPSRTAVRVAAWLTLAARLRGAAEILSGRGLLDMERALLSLLDVYADSRLRVLGHEQESLETLIAPRIEQWFAANPVTRGALGELLNQLPEENELKEPLERLLRVTEEPPGKASRFPSHPGLPGRSGLACLPRQIPK
jgi:hypothetical protein